MTLRDRRPLLAVVAVIAVLSGAVVPAPATAADRPPADAGRWIVAVAREGGSAIGPRGTIGPAPRLRPIPGDPAAGREVGRLIRAGGIRPSVIYRHAFNGFAATLSPVQLAMLRRDRAVAVLVPDVATHVERDTTSSAVRRTRLDHPVTPTGIRRIRADLGPLSRIDGSDDQLDVDVAVVDTGIAPSRELRIAGGYDCSSDDPAAWRDREGHGTHVAGTIGARDDGRGVVGVAPGARLWAIKIFDDGGNGMLSQELCGLDRVLGMRDPDHPSRPRVEVVNLSIGQWLARNDDRDCGRPLGDLVHGAICALVADGTVVVAAAGNQSVSTQRRQPAAYDEVITVSALADFDGRPGGHGEQRDICPWYSRDADDTFGDFSNFGPDVDLIAPGKCILSTLPDGWYGWSTGTSMATPHVVGAVALLAAAHPGATPGQIRGALLAAATDDWATGTDPDHHPDPLLDVSGLADLPDFDLVASDPSDELAHGGLTRFDVTIEREGGDRGLIDVRVPGLPDGVTAEVAPSPTRGSAVAIWLHAGPGAPDGPLELTIRATDGDLVRTTTAAVRVRSGGPTITFGAPDGGDPMLVDGDAVDVAFVEQSPGQPPAERRVLRQWGTPTMPGSCTDVDWSAVGTSDTPHDLDPDGTPETGWSFRADLADDGCTRWLVRLVDEDGGSARFASPAVLRDTTDPRAPVVRAHGEGVWQAARGTVWIRAGTGTLHLEAIGRDPASGVVAHRFGPLADGVGWVDDPGTVAGDPSGVDIGWTPDAGPTRLDVTASDALGRVGPARTVELRIDRVAPRARTWLEPRSGTDRVTGEIPEIAWRAITDAGAGPASLQPVQRQVARPVGRSCAGVAWRDDGPPQVVALHDEQWDVRSGRCYRWTLRPTDRVGNVGGRAVSGSLFIDLSAPTADFRAPDERSEVVTTARSFVVRWTEAPQDRGHTDRLLERERVRSRDGGCPELGWQRQGRSDAGGTPSLATGLKPGYCYRWRLNLADGLDNLTVELSGAVRVVAP